MMAANKDGLKKLKHKAPNYEQIKRLIRTFKEADEADETVVTEPIWIPAPSTTELPSEMAVYSIGDES